MEKIKSNLLHKILLFVLLQVFVVTMILSGLVFIYNAGYGWYSAEEKQVKETIINEVAEYTSIKVSDQAGYDDWNHVYGFLEAADEAEGFAYEVLSVDNKMIHKINDKLIDDNTAYKIEGNYNVYDEYSGKYYEVIIKTYWKDPMDMSSETSLGYTQGMESMYKLRCLVFENRTTAIWLGLISLLASILLCAVLMKCVGDKREKENILNKIPVDLAFALCAAAVVSLVVMISDNYYNYYNSYQSNDVLVVLLLASIIGVSIVVTGFMVLMTCSIKQKCLVKNTLIYRVGKLIFKFLVLTYDMIKKVLRIVPLVWKTVLIVIVALVVNFVIAINLYWSGFAVLCWALEGIVLGGAVIYIACCMNRLKLAGRRLAEGDLLYKVETKGLFLDFAEHADNLNSIGDGMAAAVEERIKSERFKAELITNVSHDIKTPLTSIINYVDLLKKENMEDEKITEYIEVLDRQSMRLKKLAEDIVDASKASTGNVKFDIAPCKVGLLISQTIAEYKEKAEAQELDIIMKLPEDELEVLADGRRMWRVFDNLLNNICKYSQPGTRVYVSLESKNGKAVITYRNVSKYELDISEEELMERFVRGDKSRNTEGSGLGLSIARNLVELQDGSFDINIDGDLFKVIIEFSLINL